MTFHWTGFTLLLSFAVIAAAVIFSMLTWLRSGRRKSVGLLELLRFLLILMAIITLNQPERTQEIRPAEKPTVVVLRDTSKSMQTGDLLTESGGTQTTMTRAEAVRSVVEPDFWSSVQNQIQVVQEEFSSSLPDPESGTDIHSALQSAVERTPGLRAIVLLSDGDWNTGSAPGAAATRLRMKEIPILAVAAGSEERLPDLQLTVTDAAAIGVVGKVMRIPFRVTSWMPVSRDITVTLTDSAGKTFSKQLQVSGMGQAQETIEWRPEVPGSFSLTLKMPVHDGETISENNEVVLPVSVREETLKVLIVESSPRWEYRYLRNALERDPGVRVNCLLFHPDLKSTGGGRGYLDQFPSERELFDYDVVFLGDVGLDAGQLTVEQCEQLRQLVRSHAGGLVFLPGFRGRQASLLTTKLDELYPVVFTPGVMPSGQVSGGGELPGNSAGRSVSTVSRYRLTETGRHSLLTRLESGDDENERTWASLPGFYWHAGSQRARIGSQVLVVHDSELNEFGRVPLIVTRPSGTGKVLFMGTDSAWRWRRGIEDLYHYRFWGQVVRWMAYQRNMSRGQSIRLFYSPDRPQSDSIMTLNVNAMNTDGEPLRTGTIRVKAVAPSGTVTSLQLPAAGEDSWGLFSGTLNPTEAGTWTLTTTCDETSARIETVITVAGQAREQTGLPLRSDVLRELTEMTRGRLLKTNELSEIIPAIHALPEPRPEIRRIRIWSHPVWAGLMVGLLGVFWTGRKMAGLM